MREHRRTDLQGGLGSAEQHPRTGEHKIGECVAYVGMSFPAQWLLLFKIWTNSFVSLAF